MSRILVIDDDAMILRMAGFIMKKAGHEAVGVSSGEEGVGQAAGGGFAAAFIDIEMPGMNGFETLSKIRETAGPSALPVCMMTGTLTDEVKQKAAELGALGCIEKPLRAPQVTEALNKAGL